MTFEKPPERQAAARDAAAAPASVDPVLVNILSWKRPHESKSEIEFVSWLHRELAERGVNFEVKAMGCVAATVLDSRKVRTVDGVTKPVRPSTLFSCHVDTVHSEAVGKQSIIYDPTFGHIFLDKDAPTAGSCLGADDGAGIWLMLEMISAGVPGVYLFHRGEERGGLGAHAMLQMHKDWLSEFDLAVAFDRPDTYEVITHQGGQRCASDKFAKALVEQLREKGGLVYELSGRGVFTDTKVYRGVISECINLGVGYYNQHGKDEYLDYAHLVQLRDALVRVDWDTLPADRDPHEPDPVRTYSRSTWGGHGGHQSWDGVDWDHVFGHKQEKEDPGARVVPFRQAQRDLRRERWPDECTDEADNTVDASPTGVAGSVKEPTALEEALAMSLDELATLAVQDPETTLRILTDALEEVEGLRARVRKLRSWLELG